MATSTTRDVPRQINMNEFDFNIQATRASRIPVGDVCVSFMVKGKKRKYDGSTILLTSFERRTGHKFKTLSVGVSKITKEKVIFAFDQPSGSAKINRFNQDTTTTVGNRSMIKKTLEAFGFDVPTRNDAGIRLYLDLQEIAGQPKIYVSQPVRVEHISPSGEVTKEDFAKDSRRNGTH